MPGLKAKLARTFLNFLDEHGDYRTQLEEAAARAAAAEANSLFAKDRRGRKKKRRRGARGINGEEEELLAGGEQDEYEDEEEEAEELPSPPKHPQLPEDPYEQIQFYFRTFTHRTQLQVEARLDAYRTRSTQWIHDELHHPTRIPLLSGGILAMTGLLWAIKVRRKKIGGIARVHGILGKKLTLGEYLHGNFWKGRILLQFSPNGKAALDKMTEKATKAEAAALASMRPYQRKKYERFVKMEKVGEWLVTMCLILGMLASGTTLGLSLTSLARGDRSIVVDNTDATAERLDGHIYSLDGPTDSDGYPLGMQEEAEENYAACLLAAEERGIEDPTTVCDVEAFFDEAAGQANANGTNAVEDEGVPTSPVRTKINYMLVHHLRFPSALADYLTALRTQTVAYLSSLVTFLLFLASHYLAHKIHLLTIANDPMKHFVLSATDKSVKADGTVEAKRGETEAQRKRRERMLQNERLKAKMAQLAMEAKQRVEERRQRIEGAAAEEREKEEERKKIVEEQEEIVQCHSRQFMMLKAGVPEGAIVNSLLAEGIEDDEAKEIVEKLREIKARRAEEARKAEEAEAKKAEDEKKAEEEKERVVQERLRTMKRGMSKGSSFGGGSVGGGSIGSSSIKSSDGAEAKNALAKRKTPAAGEGSTGSVASRSTASTDPSVAKSAMLGQISGGGASAFGKAHLKSAARRTTPKSIPYNPAPRPGSSTIISGNMPLGVKSDKRWDRDSKSWVDAAINSPPGAIAVASPRAGKTPQRTSSASDLAGTPKKSNISQDNDAVFRRSNTAGDDVVRRIPSRAKLGAGDEEKKVDDEVAKEESGAAREAREAIIAAARLPPKMPSTTTSRSASAETPAVVSPGAGATSPDRAIKTQVSELTSPGKGDDGSDSSATPVLVRISSSPDCETMLEPPDIVPAADPVDPFQRPTARDIQAQITAVENEPEEDENAQGADVDLAPAWMHSPAFEMALRSSNDSWDRRPTSRDITAKIRAVEQYEEKAAKDKEERQLRRSLQKDDSLGIIDEKRKHHGQKVNPTSSFDMKRKPSRIGDGDSDDEISELSEPTYVSKEDAFGGRTVPRALFVPQSKVDPVLSPMVTAASALSPNQGRTNLAGIVKTMGEKGELPAPPPLEDIDEKTPQDATESNTSDLDASNKVEESDTTPAAPPRAETEEEKKRRERAEARARKMEAIAERRNAGKDADDDESAVSGISKRRSHMRRKKKKEAELAAMEENSVKSDGISQKSDDKSGSAPAREETEEEKQRKRRAEARAKKLEAMAARRNAGKAEDDDTAVTGISKRHRLRRKKSALAAINPEEKERNDWKQSVFASVIGAEQKQWQKCIFAHVLNAEATLETNREARRQLDEQNAAALRRMENQKRLDRKAKKFAARAERFHKIRREGGGGDDTSVVSTASRLRRRRGRKSSVMSKSVTKVDEATTALSTAPAQDGEEEERVAWRTSVFASVLDADQCKWKTNVYAHVLAADESKMERNQLEAELEKQRAAAELRKEKERKVEERAKKMERMKMARDGANAGVENIAPDESGHPAESDGGSVSLMKKMRNRRKKAAKKNKATP